MTDFYITAIYHVATAFPTTREEVFRLTAPDLADALTRFGFLMLGIKAAHEVEHTVEIVGCTARKPRGAFIDLNGFRPDLDLATWIGNV